MSTTYKISQLRDLFNDWETGLDQAVTLIPLFPIDVINEYWSMGWMQNPANPDDRWKSDWIRAVLMAYAPQGSLPYEAKKQDKIRHSKSFAGNTKDKVNELGLTSEWSHLSENILNNIIKSLNVDSLKFTSFNLFKKYLSNPVDVTHINVDINRVDIFITNDVYNLAKNIATYIPRNIESLQLCIDDKYEVNFSENALLEFNNLKSFTFECNSNNGVFNFTNNTLLEKVKIISKNETDKLDIKGLNNCLQLNEIDISSKYNPNIVIQPIEISRLTNLMFFYLDNVTYQGDIKGIVKKEFCLNKFWYRNEFGVIKGIQNIDIEVYPSTKYNSKEVVIKAIPDLETLKIHGEANVIEIKELPKLKELHFDLQGVGKTILLNFTEVLASKPQIKAHQLKLLTLSNYKNKAFPYVIVNEVGEDIYNDNNNGKLIFKIDQSALESLDGLENIKCDTALLLNANNELKKLFEDPSISCENIKKLVITNSTITNLDGIHQFPNLTELVLNDLNTLATLNGLETLTQLKTLDLTNCSLLTSLEPLVNLSGLTDLKLSGCLAIKPKPKRLNLSGMQVFEELKRHNKSKSDKKTATSKVSISKIVELFNVAETDSINQGFMLLNLCDAAELNRLYNAVDFDEKSGKLVFTYLPKSILEDENASRLISLLLLLEAPEESLAGKYRNKIEALFLNCDSEIKKPKISLGSDSNIDFTSYINSIGKFSKFKQLKRIQIEELATFDFFDMAEVPSLIDIHISNIKNILNFENIAANKNVINLTIQEQYFYNRPANHATRLPDVNFSSNFSSLEYLKLNLNLESLTGLENLTSCKDLRLISHSILDSITFNSNMNQLEYIYLKGCFCTIEHIEQLQKLQKLDITQATLTEPKFLINLLSNEDYILKQGILENTKFL